MKLSKFHFVGVLLGLLSFGFWVMLASSPNVAESIYAREIYPAIATVLAFAGALLPFAVTDLIFAGAAFGLVYWAVAPWFREKTWQGKLFYSAADLIAFGSILLFLTCASFLYNHHRFTEEKLFELEFEFGKQEYQRLVEQSVIEANVLSKQFHQNDRECTDIGFELNAFDVLIEQQQSAFLRTQDLPAVQGAKTRYFLFSWIWAGMSVSGQYQPLAGQPNIAREIPVYSKPFVMAHERGHLNGFASEVGANLLAYQTLLHSTDARLQYLARLDLWRSNAPEGINEQVARDLQCWQEDWDKVERFEFDFLFTRANDFYLKASGHKDGVESYGRGRSLALKYYYKHFVQQ